MADTSVMPDCVRANAIAMAICERMANFIREGA